jgi:hypothetical protein
MLNVYTNSDVDKVSVKRCMTDFVSCSMILQRRHRSESRNEYVVIINVLYRAAVETVFMPSICLCSGMI